MEPRLNIKVAELFDKTATDMTVNPDVNFMDPSQQWPGDFIDQDSNHFQKNMEAYMEQRQGLGDQIQRYVDESHMHATDENPAQDPMLMVMNPSLVNSRDLQDVPAPRAARKFASQAQGFRANQARPDFTLGLVASVSTGSIVNARVVAETPSTKIAGTVIAVGDAEFAVVWDDRTASVERKSDYELVIAQ
jgi:hypothetical protein